MARQQLQLVVLRLVEQQLMVLGKHHQLLLLVMQEQTLLVMQVQPLVRRWEQKQQVEQLRRELQKLGMG